MPNCVYEKKVFISAREAITARITNERGVTDLIEDFSDQYYAAQINELEGKTSLTAKLKLEEVWAERLLRQIKIIEREQGEHMAVESPLVQKFIQRSRNIEELTRDAGEYRMAANQ